MPARLQERIFGLMHSGDISRVCPRCGGRRFERLPRLGTVQRGVLPFFNLYPWRCVLCTRVIYRTLRRNEEDPANRY